MDQLGLFAKFWQPGRVKTRLAAEIGTRAASEIYRAFLAALLERLARLEQPNLRRVLAYWPPQRRGDFEAHSQGWQLQPQCEGDLGERMRSYFDRAFAAGAGRVVLLGTDSPNVPLSHVQQAFDLLQGRAVVVGPSADGGYYLIGASGSTPDIFTGIDWSSPDVFQQTIEQVNRLRLSWGMLPAWYDVDMADDLRRLIADLDAADDPALVKLRAAICAHVAE